MEKKKQNRLLVVILLIIAICIIVFPLFSTRTRNSAAPMTREIP